MKVLWFTPIPILKELNSKYKGGVWITSLLDNLKNINEIELAVCFNSKQKIGKITYPENVIYYNIYKKDFLITKWVKKISHKLIDEDTEKYFEVINDFKPDIIQIFGTETGFGKISCRTNVPIIIHVQGLINPCLNAWFPQGGSLFKTLFFNGLIALLKGNGFFHKYFKYKKQAIREIEIIKNSPNYFTRTDWDSSFIKFINPKANIFHCDEMLRDIFKIHKWKHVRRDKKIFISIINGEIYKGWDNILRIALNLKKYTDMDFEWRVIGVNPSDTKKKLFENLYGNTFAENNVAFIGEMDARDIVSELLNANLFLHVSHIDNSPNSVCEAMMVGMPVFCTNIGGCPSLVENYKHGVLLPDNDPFFWAAKIQEAFNNTEQLKKYGANAKELAIKRHDNDVIVKTIINTYKQLISG